MNIAKDKRKVLVNKCYGGFGISKEAKVLFCKKVDITYDEYLLYTLRDVLHSTVLVRCLDVLIEVIEELGNLANGFGAKIEIIEIPIDVEFQIEEYDGMEWIAEKHRTW